MSEQPPKPEQEDAYKKYCKDVDEEDARDGLKPFKYYTPLDDYLKLHGDKVAKGFREAALTLCDIAALAKKLYQQVTGKEDVPDRDLLEWTRLLLLERQYQEKKAGSVK